MLPLTDFSPRKFNRAIFALIACHVYVNLILVPIGSYSHDLFLSLFAFFFRKIGSQVLHVVGRLCYFQKRGDLCQTRDEGNIKLAKETRCTIAQIERHC